MTGFELLKKKIAGMNLDELAEFYECLNGCPSNIELKNDCTQSCKECWKEALKMEHDYNCEQKEAFKALKLLGYNFMTKDKDGAVFAFIKEPVKAMCIWKTSSKHIRLPKTVSCIFELVSWSDTEPFKIPDII